MVSRLLAAGANVNAEAINGDTPLISAVKANHADVAKQLILAHADFSKVRADHVPETASSELKELLRSHGLDLPPDDNDDDDTGNAAQHHKKRPARGNKKHTKHARHG